MGYNKVAHALFTLTLLRQRSLSLPLPSSSCLPVSSLSRCELRVDTWRAVVCLLHGLTCRLWSSPKSEFSINPAVKPGKDIQKGGRGVPQRNVRTLGKTWNEVFTSEWRLVENMLTITLSESHCICVCKWCVREMRPYYMTALVLPHWPSGCAQLHCL